MSVVGDYVNFWMVDNNFVDIIKVIMLEFFFDILGNSVDDRCEYYLSNFFYMMFLLMWIEYFYMVFFF